MKSERLKKLESELADLTKWMELGLVPKKELSKHQDEIKNIKRKIEEEKSRLKMIKETGEFEEIVTKKKPAGKQVYSEPQTLPDVEETPDKTEEEAQEEAPKEKEKYKEEATVIEELDEDPFSDKNRWKRGVLEDPDADIW